MLEAGLELGLGLRGGTYFHIDMQGRVDRYAVYRGQEGLRVRVSIRVTVRVRARDRVRRRCSSNIKGFPANEPS